MRFELRGRLKSRKRICAYSTHSTSGLGTYGPLITLYLYFSLFINIL
ncbi:hypothetical protein NEISICOT_03191 [Neisseria sicca ATCC 29256]|uniref:Uncharacterized protein n=1 Tax=Neisseria sicca ATCC 29256 TaxID=547045 RepID=C6M9H2_NEISI|nr:hypothetical protein NEISICOT_03191 [Neisseria sicca ATCC 29256]